MVFFGISYVEPFFTYKLPANPAALFSIMVGSGGLHMMMSSWSDIMTTPGNWGNQMRTCTKPCNKMSCFGTYHILLQGRLY
jgi:hypothetical protein